MTREMNIFFWHYDTASKAKKLKETILTREKRLKNWKRKWKLELIERRNPKWLDLYNMIV